MSDKEARRPVSPGQEAASVSSVPSPPSLDLQIAKLSDVGRVRPHNEDYVAYFIPADPGQLERKGTLFLVADGMGGHQAGEVASQGAVELVTRQYYSDTTHDIGTSLVRAFRAANQQIYSQAQADPAKAGMGTTLVAAVILGRKVYVANVGDSRAYLINKKGIAQITEDHSWVEEQLRAGLLNAEQAHRHPQRNLLTRALGSKPTVDVDLFEGELGEDDALLLCTDGLTGRVEDAEIAAIVQGHPTEEAARLLVAQANERGGNDNITVLIVRGQKEAPTVAAPLPPPAPAKQARPLPLVPILAGIAGVLVLVLAALLVGPALLGGRETATPSLSPTASLPAPSDTPAPTIALTPTIEATVAPITATLPAGTAETPGGPTATLAATYTPTPPTPTLTPISRPGPTGTAGPTATGPASSEPAPILQEPAADAELKSTVTFRWSHSRPLAAGRAFQVLIWREGATEHNGAADYTSSTEQPIDLDLVPQIRDGGPGYYYWSVVVVDTGTDKRVGPEASPRRFTYPEPQQPPPKPEEPSATPEKTTSGGG